MSNNEPDDESTADSEQQAEEQAADGNQPAEQSEEQVADEQPAEQSDDTPASDSEQSTEQPGEEPAQDTDQPADSDQPAEQSEEQPADSVEPTEPSEEQPAENEQPAEQSNDRPADDQPADGQSAEEKADQPSDDSLSPSRSKVVNEILPEVIPAKYKHGSNEEQARFERLLPGVDIEAQRKATSGYTTCGALPAYVLKRLGGITDKGVLCGGLAGVRDGLLDKQGKYHGGAKALGAWVNHDGENRPRPGDIYILEGPIHYTDKATGADKTSVGIRHIGIIVSITKNSDGTEAWVTADAGQGIGVNQEADKQTRTYDPNDKTVTGKADKGTVVGWVDLDLLVSKSAGN
jgi:chemotaxis protein histidine kinase CheA